MPQIDFATIPTGINLSEERVNELATKATELSTAFARRLGRIMETFAEAKLRYSADAEALVASASDPETRRAARQLAKVRLAKAVLDFRLTLVKSSESERADMLRQLKALAEEAEQIATVCATPAMMLGRMMLGDTRRTNIQVSLAEAGPTELETAARLSIITGDTAMAAAICTVVDRRPRDRRPFTVNDFATRVIGIVHENMTRQLVAVQLAWNTAFAAEREFVRGQPDPLTNLSLALARRGAANAVGTAVESGPEEGGAA